MLSKTYVNNALFIVVMDTLYSKHYFLSVITHLVN